MSHRVAFETLQCFLATETEHRLGRFAQLLLLFLRRRHLRSEETRDRLLEPPVLRPELIGLLDDVGIDEAVVVTRNGTNETRLLRQIAKTLSQNPDRLRQGPIGYDDVTPNEVEDLVFGHGLVSPRDEQEEQVAVSRNERDFLVAAQKKASRGR